MVGAQSYKYSGGSNAAEKLNLVQNFKYIIKQKNQNYNSKFQKPSQCPRRGQHIRDIFRRQILQKRSEKLTLQTTIHFSKPQVNGPNIVQTFHLSIRHLPNAIEQSTRDTFRWQIVQKKVGKTYSSLYYTFESNGE